MKLSTTEISRQAEVILRSALSNAPGLMIRSVASGSVPVGIDLRFELEAAHRPLCIAVEILNSGQPRWVREAGYRLHRIIEETKRCYGVIFAPFVSDRGAMICKESGFGYMDLSGNGYLSFPGFYFERVGIQNKFTQQRELRTLYSRKAARILRVLLFDPSRRWPLSSLAKETAVSIGEAFNVKEALLAKEWGIVDTEGIRLSDPERLLVAWARYRVTSKSSTHSYYARSSIPKIERSLARECAERGIRLAFTGFSAAEQVMPAVRYSRIHAYLDGPPDAIAAQMEFVKVQSGGNVHFLVPDDESVFWEMHEVSGLPVVNPVQIYLDLIALKDRGEEAAQALLDNYLRPSWKS